MSRQCAESPELRRDTVSTTRPDRKPGLGSKRRERSWQSQCWLPEGSCFGSTSPVDEAGHCASMQARSPKGDRAFAFGWRGWRYITRIRKSMRSSGFMACMTLKIPRSVLHKRPSKGDIIYYLAVQQCAESPDHRGGQGFHGRGSLPGIARQPQPKCAITNGKIH